MVKRLILCFALFAISAQPALAAPKAPDNDPLEGFNRAIFEFNHYADMLILKPAAQTYDFILPTFARSGIRNFLSNLSSPVQIINETLQGDLTNAGIRLNRFIFNSTVGVAGLWDFSASQGIEAPTREDFGQTLASWGVGSGPYLVLPFLGPSNARDAVGRVVDIFIDPVTLWAMHQDEDAILIGRTALTALETRTQLLGVMGPMYDDSVDPYLTFKNVYEQHRMQSIQDRSDQEDYREIADNTAADPYDLYDSFESDY